jgi:hypothetical protein
MAGLYLFVDVRYVILGLVVAQIDPLSVAAMLGQSTMSERAKTILQAWSSFDDPVTTLLTIYALALMGTTGSGVPGDNAGLLGYAGGLWANLAFACGALLLWWIIRYLLAPRRPWFSRQRADRAAVIQQVVLVAGLLALLSFAVWQVLMLGIALAGLFFRPKLDWLLPAVLNGALLAATFALGLLLVDGVNVRTGCVLGILAVVAQALAAAILPARLNSVERCWLGLGQQNGITAIILALAIEPVLPGTVAIVAPAILFINVGHLIANGALGWWLARTTPLSPRSSIPTTDDPSP